MQILENIKAAWRIFQAVNQVRKDLDAAGVRRFSRERAKILRRRLQVVAMDIMDRKDRGWRKWLHTDDALGPFFAEFLDSELLWSYISAKTTLERLKVRQRILAEAAGPDIGTSHGNHP